jgi:N-acetylglutamate synthase-like GNAT family acetyltransferase
MIRKAELSDVGWLLEQLKDFDEFFGTTQSLFPDTDKAKSTIEGLTQTQPFFIAENGERQGFIVGVVGRHPYKSDILVMDERFWWVAPKYRGTSVGARLLHRYIEHGREIGVHWNTMVLEDNSPINPESLKRLGYRPKETTWLLEY